MRGKILILALPVLIAFGFGLLLAEMQSDLTARDLVWDARSGAPLPDDKRDDEGDDEGGDCPPYPPHKTWQTECWGTGGPSVPCTGTGQDGEYQMGVMVLPRFTDNFDGTITDNLTGLIWLQRPECLGLQDWAEALSAANTLADGDVDCALTDGSVAGDWRLPNIKELLSVIDYNEHYPALPEPSPFLWDPMEPQHSRESWWTSTTWEDDTYEAWAVEFYFGHVRTWDKEGRIWWTWAVRGGQQ